MSEGIELDDLNPTLLPSREHVVPAMKDGITVRLTVGQIIDLLEIDTRLAKAGGTMTGNITFQDNAEGVVFSGGTKFYDTATVAVMLLNDGYLRIFNEAGTTEIFRLREAEAAPLWKGQAVWHAGNDGAGSGLDADLLDGQDGAYYRNAGNLNAGTLPDARVSATLTADKAFRRGNVLGTVAQSSGVPTGALIERGSNANGSYIRFADGTQLCWYDGDFGLSASAGVLASATWTYPAIFSAVPQVIAGIRSVATTNSYVLELLHANPAASTATIDIRATATQQYRLGLFTSGRWF